MDRGLTHPWRVPESYRVHARQWPGHEAWLPGLGRIAVECAVDWRLEPDGPPMHGWVSMVWPVRDRRGRAYVLKVSPPLPETAAEAAALTTWAPSSRGPHRMVVPERVDPDRRALLLPRLDHRRSLEDHPDLDGAVAVIADLLHGIHGVAAPAGVPRLVDQLPELAERIAVDSPVRTAYQDRARSRIAELINWLDSPGAPADLLHNDCHFANVLADPDGPGWVGIDPLPVAGPAEWELTPMLRNRWAGAVATGDADRALRRRVDLVSEVVGLDRELVRSCAQVVAVFNLVGVLPPDHLHYPPYTVMATW